MPFHRDHIYPHLVNALGDPPPIREVRQRIVRLAQGTVLEIGMGPGVNFVHLREKMNRTPIVMVMMSAVICSIIHGADSACKLPPNLFQRRSSLARKLDSEIKANAEKRGAVASLEREVKGKIKDIDEEYYRFMAAVSDGVIQNDKAQLNSCCTHNTSDPVALLTCKLAFRLSKRSSSEQFVNEFPASGSPQQALWALDDIANVEQTRQSLPELFKPDGPVSWYITELFKVATTGDAAALQKYLDLYRRADGQYAELMEDQMERLFLEHPRIVLQNWSIIRSNRAVLDDLQELLSSDQKRRITSWTKRHCSINAIACKELIAALN